MHCRVLIITIKDDSDHDGDRVWVQIIFHIIQLFAHIDILGDANPDVDLIVPGKVIKVPEVERFVILHCFFLLIMVKTVASTWQRFWQGSWLFVTMMIRMTMMNNLTCSPSRCWQWQDLHCFPCTDPWPDPSLSCPRSGSAVTIIIVSLSPSYGRAGELSHCHHQEIVEQYFQKTSWRSSWWSYDND